MDSLLLQIISLCKCGVFVEANQHRDYYQTAAQSIAEMADSEVEEIDGEVLKTMMNTNTIISIQFYPSTPVGFYKLYHYDLEPLLKEAFKIAKREHDRAKGEEEEDEGEEP